MNALRSATVDAAHTLLRSRVISEARDQSTIQRKPVHVEAECSRYREHFVYEAGELAEYRLAEKQTPRGDA